VAVPFEADVVVAPFGADVFVAAPFGADAH
jgi:hypothetical protein